MTPNDIVRHVAISNFEFMIKPKVLTQKLAHFCERIIICDVRSDYDYRCGGTIWVSSSATVTVDNVVQSMPFLEWLESQVEMMIVFMDEHGADDDAAQRLSNDFTERNFRCVKSSFLVGGFEAMNAQYPNVLKLDETACDYGQWFDFKSAERLRQMRQLNKKLTSGLRINKQVGVDTALYPEIIPGLYLASAQLAKCKKSLRLLNIESVVSLMQELLNAGMETLHIPISDRPDEKIDDAILKAVAFISQKRAEDKKVLVHCQAGISRSATVVLAFLMKEHELTLQEAFHMIVKSRPIIHPNEGFTRYLCSLDPYSLSALWLLDGQKYRRNLQFGLQAQNALF